MKQSKALLAASILALSLVTAGCGSGSSSSGGAGGKSFLVTLKNQCAKGHWFKDGEGPINRNNNTGEVVLLIPHPNSTVKSRTTVGVHTFKFTAADRKTVLFTRKLNVTAPVTITAVC